MAISFRSRLIILFILLVGITLSTLTWAVFRALDTNAAINAERELLVAERVFETLLEENRRQLTDRTSLLAEDFGFRQAIATNEEQTIVSALVNHGERIAADLILLMDTSGEILIGTHDLSGSVTKIQQHTQQMSSPFNELIIAEEEPFQLVMVPVYGPDLIAWVGVGFSIDENLIDSFRSITKADVSLLFHSETQSSVKVLSTLNTNFMQSTAASQSFDSFSTAYIAALENKDWLNLETSLLNDGEQRIDLVLSVSLQQAIATNRDLQTQMLVITIFILILAFVVSIFIANSFNKPIHALVKAARRIARGEYQHNINVPGNTEFNELGETLNQMQHDIQEREQHISHQAEHDLLTNLPNRHKMASILNQQLSDNRYNGSLGVLLVKLVNFEPLSDIYGMSIMDSVLKQAADILKHNSEAWLSIGHVGDDEFLVLVQLAPNQNISGTVATIKNIFAKPIYCNQIELTLDTRIGAVICPEHADNYEDTLRRAHIAMNEARLTNSCHFLFDTRLEKRYLRKLEVTQRLQQAITTQSFTLLFQPQFNLKEGRVHSAEALIRWHDAELGPVYPDEFIPLAESSGDITLITEWVFSESLDQLQQWQGQGFDLGVSINLSARDILKNEFIDHVLDTIKERHIPSHFLMLEVTESAIVEDMEHAIQNLRRLYDAGIQLAMDDFGTGFSSLAQLKELPVHELKIDKSFVLNLNEDADDQKIVRSTIEMAHSLGISTIAEGTENIESINLLKAMNCDAIQGYFLSKPISSADLLTWLVQFNKTGLNHETH
ncbi:EAL domain-containing protein [Reinekea forsetii]|nr:EAL domain-containing protein [Reinekea forsetii]